MQEREASIGPSEAAFLKSLGELGLRVRNGDDALEIFVGHAVPDHLLHLGEPVQERLGDLVLGDSLSLNDGRKLVLPCGGPLEDFLNSVYAE